MAGVTADVAPESGLGVLIQQAEGRRRQRWRLVFVFVWIVILLALVTFVAGTVELDAAFLSKSVPFILAGVTITLFVSFASIVLAILLAMLGALGRLSSNPVLNAIASFYVSFFRGTPLLLQILFLYLGLPQAGIVLPALPTGIIALGFNYGAYMTEIFRAGIQAVPHGQSEAAEALGMSYRQKMRKVVLPQAMRIIIPPTGNEFIAMMKDTALIGLLGTTLFWADPFRVANLDGKAAFKNLEALFVAALVYWGLTAVFSYFQRRLETRMSKGYVRGAPASGKFGTRFIPGSAAGGYGSGAMMVEMPESDAPEPGPEGGGQEH
jgi:polar amino acid transport system permease protein